MSFSHDYDLKNFNSARPPVQQFHLHATPAIFSALRTRGIQGCTTASQSKSYERTLLLVDVGTCYGLILLLAAPRHPHLQIGAIEPVRENFTILNVEIYRSDNIRPLPLSGSEDNRSIHISFVSSSSASMPTINSRISTRND